MLHTPRLLLRPWQDGDLEPLLAMSQDPDVVRFLPGPMTRAEAVAFLARQREEALHGRPFLFVVESRDGGEFVGFTGLSTPRFEAAFTPCVEVGWRLRREVWGSGFATEAAAAALEHGFTVLGLTEVVSFTSLANTRSVAVMRRLGMRHSPEEDFDHPLLPAGHPLRRHVLYRLSRHRWDVVRADGTPRRGLD